MKVTFNINFHTVWGQKLCVVGSIPELGSWEPALAKEMSYKGDGNWQLELEVTSDRKSTRLNSSHQPQSRMPSSA